ncbi:TetR/AcrR family transcriptional regulator [Pseudarthrobacter sp. NPDC092439]|uniref:TetR/AcrR family transcriptional regulator n=1 Tax=unclassified Pseudarthrobacter TaxID=2647000 RepID=UPI00382CB89A
MPETFPDHPPMAARPSAPRQRLRYSRILEVAGSFARKGLCDVELTDVAAQADVPLGTMYRYFPTRTHLMLALYRHQLEELAAGSRVLTPRFRGRGLTGLVMEIFHMRVMQPAVEQCLSRGVYLPHHDATALLREIDELSERAVAEACGDRTSARILLLAVTGLVQSVRNRRLSLFEAEEDLKKACSHLSSEDRVGYTLHQSA